MVLPEIQTDLSLGAVCAIEAQAGENPLHRSGIARIRRLINPNVRASGCQANRDAILTDDELRRDRHRQRSCGEVLKRPRWTDVFLQLRACGEIARSTCENELAAAGGLGWHVLARQLPRIPEATHAQGASVQLADSASASAL